MTLTVTLPVLLPVHPSQTFLLLNIDQLSVALMMADRFGFYQAVEGRWGPLS